VCVCVCVCEFVCVCVCVLCPKMSTFKLYFGATQRNAIPYSKNNTAKHSTAEHSTAQHKAIHCNTIHMISHHITHSASCHSLHSTHSPPTCMKKSPCSRRKKRRRDRRCEDRLYCSSKRLCGMCVVQVVCVTCVWRGKSVRMEGVGVKRGRDSGGHQTVAQCSYGSVCNCTV
jgi:hypothetical protein